MSKLPRVVFVTRPSEYEGLLMRHGTRGQVQFFLESRGRDIDEVESWHDRFHAALSKVQAVLPRSWRRSRVTRADLDRFLFEPDDVIVAVGQDGLVANVAKYLTGQRVIGVNPDPSRMPGVLVPLNPTRAARMILRCGACEPVQIEARTMVEARLDDGQVLRALNEVFVGHASHQSARYRIGWRDQEERQSSSGVIVSTGTGATGWASSVFRNRRCEVELPKPEEARLMFAVREAWPSKATGTSIAEGRVEQGRPLRIVSEMPERGVIFGDGIEDDSLVFGWGQQVEIGIADHRLHLVRGAG